MDSVDYKMRSFQCYLVLFICWPALCLAGSLTECPSLTPPENGLVSVTGLTQGSFAGYTCDEGYSMNGINFQQCQSDFSWSNSPPTCDIKDCGNATLPTDGGTNQTTTTFGSQVDYYCNEGYDLSGSTNATCEASGSWSVGPPTCTIVDCSNASLPTDGGTNQTTTTFGSEVDYFCNEGYDLSGSTNATCEDSGSWSAVPPTCTIVDCSNASLPTDGGTNQTTTTFGSQVDYYCNEGYDLSGSTNATCEASGSWSVGPPTCTIVDCGNATLPTDGGTNQTTTTFGSQVDYYCDEGYDLSGSTNAICEASGSWSVGPPTCTIVECSNASLPIDGGANQTTTTFGSQVDYYCNEGYDLSGSTNATCEASGSWSVGPPTCTIVDCGNASLPTDGGTNQTTTIFGSQVDYYCDVGYDLSGSTNATCEASGSWSVGPPTCTIVDCSNASLPTDGGTNQTTTTFGSQVDYYCDVGYNLSGSAIATCEASGSWSDGPPTCTLVDCGPVEASTHGFVNTASGTTFGMAASYTCDTGYEITGGDNVRFCKSDGSWTSTDPYCILVDCGNFTLSTDGGANYTNTTYESQVDYYCDEGYDLSGATNATCEDSGSWSYLPPNCTIVDCGNASLPTDGGTNQTTTTFGSQVDYYCNEGYDLSGSTNATCEATSSWSLGPPTCTIVDCGNASLPTDGFAKHASTIYGSQVDYDCDVGYNLSGATNATCEATGSWSLGPPTCDIIDCGNASLPTDGWANQTSTTFGSKVEYYCDEGYDLSGAKTTICMLTGDWIFGPPNCTIVDCGNASLPTDGGTNQTDTTFGAQVDYYCNEGYDLSGSTNATCEATGSWSVGPPTCTIVDCGNATLPTDGGTNQTTTTFGSQVDYYCNEGYDLSGATNATCEASGSWSVGPPTCTIVDCGNATLPTDGGTNQTDTTFGSQVDYYCNEGYDLSGATNATCEATGSWSFGPPTCTIVDCGNATLPADGGTNQTDTIFGSQVDYYCNEGYDLSGATNATCEATGSWSFGPPTCTIVDCGNASLPTDGGTNQTTTTFGSQVDYYCNEGYDLSGSTNATCEATGSWSFGPPTCTIVDCGNATLPTDGGTNQTTTTFGSQVDYYCNEGYDLSGSTNATCEATGSWSFGPPTCTIVDCANASLPTDGGTNQTTTTFGSQVDYYCNEGYDLSGSTNATCEDSGSWSAVPPTCTIVDCSNATLPTDGGTNQTTTTFGSQVDYYCNEGYDLSGPSNATCEASGLWSALSPNCTIIDCGPVEASAHGFVNTASGTTFGMAASYTCDTGYEITGGSNVRFCELDGNWTSTDPYCILVDCGNFTLPTDGGANYTNTTYESQVDYFCNEGYDLSGATNATCEDSGSWSTLAPNCTIVDCSNASLPTDGGTNQTTTTFGSQVDYYCNEGYDLSGPSNATCEASGSWSVGPPSCILVDCGNALLPTDGGTNQTTTTFGSQVDYYCNEGYDLSGSTNATCEASGSWSEGPPTCTIVDCGNATLPTDGGTNETNTTFGSQVDYYCDEGYDLSGSTNATCEASGLWSDGPPTCTIVDCGNASLPTDGRANQTNTTYQSQVDYYCYEGYDLSGATNAICEATGSWSSGPPTCTIVDCGPVDAPMNGFVNFDSGTTFGMAASYTCETGYNLTSGDNVRFCASDGNWTSTDPQCDIVDCRKLPDPTDGIIEYSSNSTTYESVAEYVCNTGYERVNGSRQRTCLDDGTWNGTESACTIFMCPQLSSLNNGSTNGTGYEYGSIYTYLCDEGFNLSISNNTIVCGEGTWDPEPPVCIIKDCGPLNTTIDNGDVIETGTEYGDVFTYTCNNTYMIEAGVTTITINCTAEGVWDNVAPTCIPTDCGELVPPENGQVNTQPGTDYDKVAAYTCDDGYVLQSNNIRRCQANGLWDGTVPTCQIVECGNLTSPTNGTVDISSGTTYLKEAIYTCDPGYENVTGSLLRTCQGDALWDGTPPVCQRKVCGDLLNITNGVLVLTGTEYGDVAVYQCLDGFFIEQGMILDVLYCNETGVWNGTIPDCVPVDCGDLSAPDGGQVHYYNGSYGEIASYTCNTGYDSSGINYRECQADGFWNNSPLKCQIRDCGPLTPPTYGNVSVNLTTYEELATYSCITGYHITNGSSIVICAADGLWNDTEPLCEIWDCGKLPSSVIFGELDVSNTTYGETAEYMCDMGYRISGTNDTELTLSCLDGGMWSDVPPTCTIVDCGNLTHPENGEVSVTMTTYRESASYNCSIGYHITSGSSITYCDADGNWNHTQPVCEIWDCGPLNAPSDGYVDTSQGTTYMQIANYTCMVGYEFRGQNTSQCEADGTWSGSPPTCVIYDCGPLSDISHGTLSVSNTTYNETAVYTCEEGHVVTGTNDTEYILTCLDGGEWSDIPQNCTIVDCGPVEAPLNGNVDTSQGTTYLQYAAFTCNDGYLAVGPNIRQCQADGTWSEEQPTCAIFDCGDIERVNNSMVYVNVTTYTASAIYTCNQGYYHTSGDIERTCIDGGTWNGTAPTCTIYDCGTPLDVLENGKIVGNDTLYSDSIFYHCDYGYVIQGTEIDLVRTVCQHGGNWSVEPPVCDFVDCGRLDHPLHGEVVTDDGTGLGHVAIYSCHPWFQLDHDRPSVCQASGVWSDVEPVCVSVLPPREYECGFRHEDLVIGLGISERTSRVEFDIMKDVVKYIISVSDISHDDTRVGVYVFTDTLHDMITLTEYNHTQTYQAAVDDLPYIEHTGRSMLHTGLSTLINMFNTTDGNRLHIPDYAFFILDDFTSTSGAVELAEQIGHIGIQLQIMMVEPNLDNPYRWEALLDTGVELEVNRTFSELYMRSVSKPDECDCGIPTTPEHGEVNITGTFYMDTAIFSCSDGYNLSGPGEMVCQYGGLWNSAPPLCLPIDEVIPPPPPMCGFADVAYLVMGIAVSGRTDAQVFDLFKALVQKFVEQSAIDQQIVHFGFFVFDNAVQDTTTIELSDYLMQEDILTDVNNTVFVPASGRSRLSAGLSQTLTMARNRPVHKQHVQVTAFIILDDFVNLGGSGNLVNQLQENGVLLNFLAVGFTNTDDLENLVHSRDQVLSVENTVILSYALPYLFKERSCDCGEPADLRYGYRSNTGTYFLDKTYYSCYDGFELLGPEVIQCQLGGVWNRAPPTCRPQDFNVEIGCGFKEADVVIAMGVSSEMSEEDYNSMQESASRLVRHTAMVEDFFHVGSFIFNEHVISKSVMDLDTTVRSEGSRSTSIGYTSMSGPSVFHVALKQIVEMSSRSSRRQSDIPIVAIIYVDTNVTVTDDARIFAEVLHEMDVVVVINVVSNLAPNETEFDQVLNDTIIHTWSSFQDIDSMAVLDGALCVIPPAIDETCGFRNLDLVFVLGVSNTTDDVDFDAMKNVVRNVIRVTDVDTTLITVINSVSADPSSINIVEAFRTRSDVNAFLDRIQYTPSTMNASLNDALTVALSILHPTRVNPSTGKLLYVITDGHMEVNSDTVDILQLMHVMDIHVDFIVVDVEDTEIWHMLAHTQIYHSLDVLQLNASTWYKDPLCQCDDVSQIDNGSVSTMEERYYLDTLSFTCNPGFELRGSQQIQCLYGGGWSGPPPVCVRRATTKGVNIVLYLNMTSSPDLDSNSTYSEYVDAVMKALELHYGAFMKNRTLDIVINNIRAGSLFVSFTITLPNDVESVESFAEATADLAAGATVEVLNETLAADQVFLEDNQVDLVTVGVSSATCITFVEVNGACDVGYICQLVNTSIPVCLPDPSTDCGYPGIFLSGSLDITDGTLYGNQAIYTCYYGYRLVGNDTRYCSHDTLWYPEPPTCQLIDCGDILAPENGFVDTAGGTTLDQTATFTCDTGYNLVGSATLNCTEEGLWDTTVPICKSLINYCDVLSYPENGYIISGDLQLGSTATYGCDTGYRLDGPSTRTCSPSTNWQPVLNTTCIILDCGDFDTPENGMIDVTDTTYGHTATFSCNPGYHIAGESLLTCTDDGMWSADVPTCQMVSEFCGGLLDPLNGRSNITVVSDTELAADFDCFTGYKLTGPASRTCYIIGPWIPNQMTTCVLYDCGILPNPNNGNVDQSSGTTYGQVVHYSCIAGYQLFGEAQAICNADGEWSQVPPVCQVTNCGGLANPENGVVTAEENTFGQVASYSCNPGYDLTGNKKRICQTDSTWSGTQPTCLPKDCGTLFAPINGLVDMSQGTVYGDRVLYSCRDGYELVGATESTCSQTGVWDPATAPRCLPVDCRNLVAPEHGDIELSQGLSFNSIATYSCDAGYRLSSTGTQQCTANGVWFPPVLITCNIIDCGRLVVIEDGEVLYVSNTTVYGSRATFSCNSGYTLSVDNMFSTHCTQSGTWDVVTMPQCTVVDCGQPTTVAYSDVVYTTTTFASSAEYTCNAGYELLSSGTVWCIATGVWSDVPVCYKIACGNITAPEFGSMTLSDGTLYSSMATITCDTGYKLNGPNSKICSASGEWRPTQIPTCSIYNCGVLADPENGMVDLSSGMTYGQTATFTCNTGYTRFGLSEVTCTADGTWSAPSPVCQVTDCGGLLNPVNGRVTADQTTLSQVAIYSCNPGYTMLGTSRRTCLEDSSWSGTPATCEARDCGTLSDPVDGYIVYSTGTVYGSSVEYECNTGYQVQGTAVRSCLQSGQWSGQTPTCQLIDCGELPEIEDGQADNTQSTMFGSTVTYECHSGYEIVGDPYVECLDTAQWSTPPDCRIQECNSLEHPDNGKVTVLGIRFGDSALYQCDVGYEMSGSPTRQCEDSGLWSGSVPTCTIVDCGLLSPPDNGFIEFSSGTEFTNFYVFECDPMHEKSRLSVVVCRADGTWSGQPPACHLRDGYLSLRMEIQLNTTTYQSYVDEVRRELLEYYIGEMSTTDIEIIVRTSELGILIVNYVIVIPDDEIYRQQVAIATQQLVQVATIIVFNEALVVTRVTIGDSGVNVGTLPSERLICELYVQLSGPCARRQICTVNDGLPGCSADPNTDCGIPSRPLNGKVDYERGTLLNDVIIYSCNLGYSLVGDNTLICQASGGWAPALPYCVITDCGNVEAPVYGSIQLPGTSYSDTASFTCNPDYSLIGPSSIICQADGTWSNEPPECKLTGCGGLTDPDNGRVQLTDDGLTAYYSCDTGFVLSTSGIRTCLASRIWSGLAPSCQVIVCGALSHPADGRVDYTDISYDSTATYTCTTEGYLLNGLQSRTCEGDGLWTGNAPVCDIVDCGQLLPITNGNLQLTGTEYGQTGTFSCNQDYILQGTRVLICLESGWSDAPPTCILSGNCGTLNNPANGYISLSLGSQLGSIATYACYNGYTLSGTATRTCQADNSWSASPLTCILIDCGQVSVPDGGRLDYVSGTTYSQRANYTCNTGYDLFGPTYTVCQDDGIWSNIPTCRIKDCGGLADPINGRVDTVAGTTFGSTAFYICNTGYYMQGSSNRHCLDTGLWDINTPTCLIKDCGALTNLVNGIVRFTSGTTYGQTATYTCNTGYSLSGSPTTQCTENGVWAGLQPVCVPIVCGILTHPSNGRVVLSSGRGVGSVATYRCDLSYYLHPPHLNKTCLQNASWSNAVVPTCAYVDCGILSAPLFGDVRIDSLGLTATYTCNLGYMLSGERTRTCMNNQWIGPSPSCVITDCGSLTDPSDGKVSLPAGSGYGSEAVYKCDTGYTLNGYYKRLCMTNGSWSGDAVSCGSSSDYALTVGLGVGISGFVILILIIVVIIAIIHRRDHLNHRRKKLPICRELVVTSSNWVPTFPRKSNTKSTIYLPHYSNGAFNESQSDLTEFHTTLKSHNHEYDNNPLFYSMNMPRDEQYTFYPRR